MKRIGTSLIILLQIIACGPDINEPNEASAAYGDIDQSEKSYSVKDSIINALDDSVLVNSGLKDSVDALYDLLPTRVQVHDLHRETKNNPLRAAKQFDGLVGMICGNVSRIGQTTIGEYRFDVKSDSFDIARAVGVIGVQEDLALKFNVGEGGCFYGEFEYNSMFDTWTVDKYSIKGVYTSIQYAEDTKRIVEYVNRVTDSIYSARYPIKIE